MGHRGFHVGDCFETNFADYIRDMGREYLKQWDPELSSRWMYEACRELGGLTQFERHEHLRKNLSESVDFGPKRREL